MCNCLEIIVCTSRLHAEHVTRPVTRHTAEREGAASIRARDPSTASTLPHPAPPPALALPALCLQQPCSLDATHVSQHDAPTSEFFIACGGPRVCEHTSMARLGFEPRACSFPFGGIILLSMIVDIVQVRSSRAIAAVCRTPRSRATPLQQKNTPGRLISRPRFWPLGVFGRPTPWSPCVISVSLHNSAQDGVC